MTTGWRAMRVSLMGAWLVAGLGVGWGQEVASPPQDPGWPRTVRTAGGETIVVYQPQLESWENYRTLQALAAVEVFPKGSNIGYAGAVRLLADTSTDLEGRTVRLTNIHIKDQSFKDLDPDLSAKLGRILHTALPSGSRLVSLDRLVAALPEPALPVRPAKINLAPPPIFYSESPAILVMTDGPPLLAPIANTSLMYALNTNWDLVYDPGQPRYYLLNGDYWLMAQELEGPWEPATDLPDGLSKLPEDDDWDDVRANVPGKQVAAGQVPRVFTSEKPAELVLTEGAPNYTPIEGTKLLHVANTQDDLFLYDGAYYLVTSGRWFKTADPKSGQWSVVSPDVPAEFAKIPADHAKAGVKATIPGTEEAKEAVIVAQIPQTATVKRSEAKVEVVYSGEPEFAPITGTAMSYATNTSFDVIRVGDLYYCCLQAVWFVSSSPKGPWVVADRVDPAIYTIPADSPVYTTTYVTVYEDESDADEVVFGFTAGYLLGMVIADGGCYYGTGWYWPPYVWRGATYPVYWPRPVTYGCAAWYNPHTGSYYRRAAAYGPYGGCGYGAAYNPGTGRYVRGAAAYGPYGSVRAGEVYNPRTGAHFRGTSAVGPYGGARTGHGYNPATDTGVAGYRRSNPYGSWGETVVSRGDSWAHTASASGARGSARGFETSSGASGGRVTTGRGSTGAVKTGSGDVYAGHNGNVYRKTDDGWQNYQGSGKWENSGAGDRAEPRSRADIGGAPSFDDTRAQQRDVRPQLNYDSQARQWGNQRTQQNQQWRGGSGSGSGGGSRSSGGGGRGGGGRR